jgi:hypothetical protein
MSKPRSLLDEMATLEMPKLPSDFFELLVSTEEIEKLTVSRSLLDEMATLEVPFAAKEIEKLTMPIDFAELTMPPIDFGELTTAEEIEKLLGPPIDFAELTVPQIDLEVPPIDFAERVVAKTPLDMPTEQHKSKRPTTLAAKPER